MVFLGWGRGCLDCQLKPEKEVMLKEKQRKLKLVMKETRSTMPSQKVEQYHTFLLCYAFGWLHRRIIFLLFRMYFNLLSVVALRGAAVSLEYAL